MYMEDITDARTGPGNEAVCIIAREYTCTIKREGEYPSYSTISHIVTAAGL